MSDTAQRILNRAKLIDFITNKIPFTFIDNSGIVWSDYFLPDTSHEDFFKFVAKWNTNVKLISQPSYGSKAFPQGLIEIEVPYENILVFIKLNLSEATITRMETEMPKVFEFWKNSNYEEGFGIQPILPGRKQP